MDASTIVVVVGALLTLIGIVGGGFEIKEARIPKVSLIPRILALVIGIALLASELHPKFIEDKPAQVQSAQENPLQKAEDARLAEERRGIEAEKARLAEERRGIEAEETRLADEQHRKKPEWRGLSGVYTIRQKSNGRYVDAHDASNSDYALVTRPSQNNDTQRWVLTPLGNNTYTIQQKSNGRYVDAHETSKNDYTLFTLPAQNNDTQKWVLTPLGYNRYTIQQKSNGRYVDAHESWQKGYRLVTRPAHNKDTQRWLINPL